jgi:hypothetical protein
MSACACRTERKAKTVSDHARVPSGTCRTLCVPLTKRRAELTAASSNPMQPCRMSTTTGVQAATFLGWVSGSIATKSLMISVASL